jgi:endonuclease YncB( thermonuclease family)
VLNGETVNFARGTTLQLLLIDAPELSQQPYGEQARDELLQVLPIASEAREELDVEQRDRNGRTLVYLFLPDGR